jgi:RNA recognition motif-containing protein
VILHTHEDGRSKGGGFILYSSTEEQKRAIDEANGELVWGRYLEVKYSTNYK